MKRAAILLGLFGMAAALCLPSTPSSGRSTGFDLVTPADMAAERKGGAARGLPPRVGDPNTLPRIELLEPDRSDGLKSPLRIVLRFVATPEAPIDVKSFRARYGAFGFDITDRIVRNGTVSPTGIVAEDARIPAGEHRIVLSIRDSRGAVAEREFRFVVGAAR